MYGLSTSSLHVGLCKLGNPEGPPNFRRFKQGIPCFQSPLERKHPNWRKPRKGAPQVQVSLYIPLTIDISTINHSKKFSASRSVEILPVRKGKVPLRRRNVWKAPTFEWIAPSETDVVQPMFQRIRRKQREHLEEKPWFLLPTCEDFLRVFPFPGPWTCGETAVEHWALHRAGSCGAQLDHKWKSNGENEVLNYFELFGF